MKIQLKAVFHSPRTCQPFYSWQSRFPLFMHADRKALVLYEDRPTQLLRRKGNVWSLYMYFVMLSSIQIIWLSAFFLNAQTCLDLYWIQLNFLFSWNYDRVSVLMQNRLFGSLIRLYTNDLDNRVLITGTWHIVFPFIGSKWLPQCWPWKKPFS